jgi:hypothetical protein
VRPPVYWGRPWRARQDFARILLRTRPRYRSSTQPRSPRVRVIHDRNDSALAASDPWPGGGCCQRLNDRKVRSTTAAMTATTPTDSAHNSQPVGHNIEPRGTQSSYVPRRSARRDRYSRFRHETTSRRSGRLRRRLLPDGHVLLAVACERLPLPPAPALAQPHPGKLRH